MTAPKMTYRARTPIRDAWRGARCRTLDLTAGDPVYDKARQDEMIAYCNEPEPCPLRTRCLQFALSNQCVLGVWGGMSPQDRWALRRRYPQLPPGRAPDGTQHWEPHPRWQWSPPGEAVAMLTARERRELAADEALDDQ